MPNLQQMEACEKLIDETMSRHQMSREVAIVALTIKDQKRLQNGYRTMIDGVSFEDVYPWGGAEALHEDDVARIVAFLEAVPLDTAKRITAERIASGQFAPETQH